MQQRTALICVVMMLSFAPVRAADTAGITAWGPVQGRVLDATTLKPLAGASVATWYENRTPDQDKQWGLTCLTDSAGGYQVRACIGTDHSELDTTRVINGSLVGGLVGAFTGGLNKRTTAICVDGVPLEVSCPGYKPLHAEVPLEMICAAKMLAVPRAILLVPTAATGPSYWAEASSDLQVEGLSNALTGEGPFPLAVTWHWPSPGWPGCTSTISWHDASSGGNWNWHDLKEDKTRPTEEAQLTRRWEGTIFLPKSRSGPIEIIELRVTIGTDKDGTEYANKTCFVGWAADKADAAVAQALATAWANPNSEAKAAALQRLCENNPNCSTALAYYAATLAAAGPSAAAVTLIEAAPETVRSDPSVDFRYVQALAQTGQFDKVVNHLASTQLSGNDVRNQVLGWALIMTGQREAGKRLVDKYKDQRPPGWWAWEVGKWQDEVAKNPGEANAALRLAEALYQVGRLDESRAAFDHALALKPKQDQAESIGLGLADALQDKGRADDALQVQQALVNSCPDSSLGWEALLTTLSEGPPAPLAEACAQCLTTKAVCDLAYFYKGRAQEAAGHVEEALATYAAGSKQATSSFMLYHAAACLQARRGKWAEAGVLFQAAAQNGFGDAATRFDHPEVPASYLGPRMEFTAPIWTEANLTSLNGFGSRTAQADCYLAAMAPEVMSPPLAAPAGAPGAQQAAPKPRIEETTRRYLVGKSLTVVGLIPQALQVLQPLAQKHPESPEILLALADAELAGDNTSACSQTLCAVDALLPGCAEVKERRMALAGK